MTAVTVIVALIIGAVVWVIAMALRVLVSQELRGSVPVVARRMADRASRRLPRHLADDYLETWTAELETLKDRPLTALRFAAGLSRAASAITGELRPAHAPSAGRLARRYIDSVAVGTLARYIESLAGLRRNRIIFMALIMSTLSALAGLAAASVAFAFLGTPAWIAGVAAAVLGVLLTFVARST